MNAYKVRVRIGAEKARRVLIVDDEPLVLRAVARALRREFVVTTLSSPKEALRRIASGDAWDAIVSDVMMVEMSGLDFARRAVAVRPDLAGRILLMSGGMSSDVRAAVDQSGFGMIEKPVDCDELKARLAKLCSGNE